MNTHRERDDAAADGSEPVDLRHQFEAGLDAARAQFDAVNEKIEKRAGRNLLAAIGVGVALGGVFLASLLFFKPIFVGICAIAACFAAIELAVALRAVPVYVPRVGVGVNAAAVPFAGYFFGVAGVLLMLVIALVVLLVWYAIERRWGQNYARIGPTRFGRDVFSCIGVLGYIGGLIGFAAALVALEGGEWWVLGFIIIVVANDTGAYAVGLAWGRHTMAPRISPKKSWEGFAGGIASALVAGVLVSWLMLHQPWWLGLILGAVFTLTAVAGDLVESQIKRRIGIKDMSSWLPGHGGLLDRLDSIILTAPAALLIAHIVLGYCCV